MYIESSSKFDLSLIGPKETLGLVGGGLLDLGRNYRNCHHSKE